MFQRKSPRTSPGQKRIAATSAGDGRPRRIPLPPIPRFCSSGCNTGAISATNQRADEFRPWPPGFLSSHPQTGVSTKCATFPRGSCWESPRRLLPFCHVARAWRAPNPDHGDQQPADGWVRPTPVWFGVQNGSFNVFSQGSTASSAIATLAQFGNTAPLTSLFAGNGPQTTLWSPGAA